VLVLLSAACSNWEHTTYQALAASKASIDLAGSDYNAGRLPKTLPVKSIIERARQAQTVAVHAFEVYAVGKVVGDPNASLEQKRQAVVTAAAQVVGIVAEIQNLYVEVKK
jgi:hypothetical protein